MFSISRPLWPQGKARRIKLADPFAGSGTTILESLKFENIDGIGSDIEKIAPLLAEDNLGIFSMDTNELNRLSNSISDAKTQLPHCYTIPKKFHDQKSKKNRIIMDLLQEATEESFYKAAINDEMIKKMRNDLNLMERVTFFIGLKAYIKHAAALIRGTETLSQAYSEEADALVKQLKYLASIREREASKEDLGILCRLFSEFSNAVSISKDILKRELDKRGKKLVTLHRAEDFSLKEIDVIITDPPYGFNTEENQWELAKLYEKFVINLANNLPEGSQLIMCLLERSYTGRRKRSFTGANMVSATIESACQKAGREVHVVSQGGLNPWDLLRPPFYWDAEKTLRRIILHFQFGPLK